MIFPQKLHMEIQKIYSDGGTERLYSVLLTQKEFSLLGKYSSLKGKLSNVPPGEYQRKGDWSNISFTISEYQKAEREFDTKFPKEFWKLLSILPKFIPVSKRMNPEGKYELPIDISALNIYRYPKPVCLVLDKVDIDSSIIWDPKKNCLLEGGYGYSIRGGLKKALLDNCKSLEEALGDDMVHGYEEHDEGYFKYLQAWKDFIKKNL